MIGAPGEINPLPGTPLELTSVRATGACVGIDFQVASPLERRRDVGGGRPRCHVHRRLLGARRAGPLDQRRARRVPAPRSAGLSPRPRVAATDRLRRRRHHAEGRPGRGAAGLPGAGRVRHPPPGQVVANCDASGACPQIAAPNGEERRYTANAVNAIGESVAAATTTAWAYDAPAAPREVTAAPVVTGGEGGLVSVRVAGVDAAATGFLELSSPAGELLRVRVDPGRDTVDIGRYRIGSNALSPLTVTPISRFEVPPGCPARSPARPSRSPRTASASRPRRPSRSPRSPTATARPPSRRRGAPARAVTAPRPGSASPGRRGLRRAPGGESADLQRPARRRGLRLRVCAESWWGGERYGRSDRHGRGPCRAERGAAAGWVFVVDETPTVDGAEARWMIRDAPHSSESPPRTTTPSSRADPRRACTTATPACASATCTSRGDPRPLGPGHPGAGRALPGAAHLAGRVLHRGHAAHRDRRILPRPRGRPGGVLLRHRPGAVLRRRRRAHRCRPRHQPGCPSARCAWRTSASP